LSSLANENLAALATTPGRLPAEPLADLPSPIRRRVIRAWVRKSAGVTMTLSQTQMVDALVVAWKGQGSVAIPGATLNRQEGFLLITLTTPQAED
jgi:tRNA(Ile)-lysidine synthase